MLRGREGILDAYEFMYSQKISFRAIDKRVQTYVIARPQIIGY